jgi:epoxide hydrolase
MRAMSRDTGRILVALVFAAVPAVCRAQPPAGTDTAIKPFSIRIPDAVLADLEARLKSPRMPESLAGDGWTYGTDTTYLKQLVAYWRDRFDWRAQERSLNRFEQFTTNIDGLTIHFIHRRSKQPNALPLLITHGWPGSFVEFTKVIDPLTDPAAHGGRAEDAFDLVIPSIPGFAFSEKPRDPGYSPARIAAIEAKLMARLGYQRYAVQGGDWGSIIGTQVALNDAAHVAGLHLNMCLAAAPPGDPEEGLSEAEKARLKVRQTFQAEETGYQQIQGTKPQTIGIALNDSPIGLAAWIVEKFRTWCDCDGNPEKIFTKDELLTNITLYWVTQTAASSARIYYESRHAPPEPGGPRRVEVPTACADFPKEIIWVPRRWMERRFNITRWTVMPKGGHFAAFEQPELFVDDVRAFFRTVR